MTRLSRVKTFPKGCVLVPLQHTISRIVGYTQNLSSTEAIRTIYPFHTPRHTLIQFAIANSTEKNPSWKAYSSSASQEIPRILWKPKVHYRIHNSPLPVPVLDLPANPTSWRSILALLSYLILGFSSDLFLSGLFTKTLCTPIVFPIRATCTVHAILLHFITRTIFGEQYRS